MPESTAADRPSHPDAPAGKAEKYALVERERRFLLRASPAGTSLGRVLIEDRYLRGTRLRLRRMTDLVEPRGVIHKFTQKVPAPAGRPGLITTLYLSAAEYAMLARIPADTLRKIRASWQGLAVDVFEGPLHGLILAEAEFDTEAEELAFWPPPEDVAEVTSDPRFTGGRLVTMRAEEVTELLHAFSLGR